MSFELKVWRLHPQGARVVPAEKTLRGEANEQGLRWCGPYGSANRYGFWLFPPMDIDFVWRGGNVFEHEVVSPWGGEEVDLVRGLARDGDSPEHQSFLRNFGGRLKVDFGRVEPNICQMWTGCSFRTPPGWCLLIRSPVNVGMDAPYRIQEGVLETDWLAYDIWVNIAVQRENVPIRLRRDQWPPLAQLLPVPRDAYDGGWSVSEELLHRDTEEGDGRYLAWADYNYRKYVRRRREMEKDSGTYFKERARHLGRRVSDPEPTPKPPPPRRSPKATPKRLLSPKRAEK